RRKLPARSSARLARQPAAASTRSRVAPANWRARRSAPTATPRKDPVRVRANTPAAPDRRSVTKRTTLRYVTDRSAGITRHRRRLRDGRFSFTYRHPDGRRVRDAATLQRIRALAIPPAYERVWICPHPRGHLQATCRDARGRKQYRYHPAWREDQEASKHARMHAFGQALPRLRRTLREQ